MKRELSDHAHAAKLIRAKLKQHNIPARVRASTFAMGSSVDVDVENQPPWVFAEIKRFASRFQYGHFDGMQDLYEYSNSRDDIPQVKFVMVSNKFSKEMHQKAYDYLRQNFADFEGAPEKYTSAGSFRAGDSYATDRIWQVLNGSLDQRCSGLKFWVKPHIKLEAA